MFLLIILYKISFREYSNTFGYFRLPPFTCQPMSISTRSPHYLLNYVSISKIFFKRNSNLYIHMTLYFLPSVFGWLFFRARQLFNSKPAIENYCTSDIQI